MARLGLAFRVFFRVLKDAQFAQQVERITAGTALPATAAVREVPAAPPAPAQRAPTRSEALTLLSVLQREARLIDFMKENIAPYSDAQIGAAVRDVHRDCAAALDRLFALRPVMDQAEGASVSLPAGYDAAAVRLTGNVAGQPPFRGALRHQGWQATKVELPQWTGADKAARIVAPAEVEIA